VALWIAPTRWCNTLHDLLMFPLLHEKGVGGYFYFKDGDCVHNALQSYARAMSACITLGA
jgi:hypothetical protein